MIVGGQSDEKDEDKVYALSLSPTVDVPSCLDSICDFPNYVQPTSTAILEDGLPTVCGGRNRNTNPWTYYRECFKFNFTDAWEYSGSKSFANIHSGGKQLSQKIYQMCINKLCSISAVQTDWGLVEIGGHDGVSSTATMEFTTDGVTWETMPSRYPGLFSCSHV